MKIRAPFIYIFFIVCGIFLWQLVLSPKVDYAQVEDTEQSDLVEEISLVDEKTLMQHLKEGIEATGVQLVYYQSEPEYKIELEGGGNSLVRFVKYLEKHLPYSLESVTLEYKSNDRGYMMITI